MVSGAPWLMAALSAASSQPHVSQAIEVNRVPVTTEDLVELAEITAPTLSPDGRLIAYRVSRASVDTNTARLTWYVQDSEGRGTPVALAGGADRPDASGVSVETAPVWDADSLGLRFLALSDGITTVWHWREDAALGAEIADEADVTDFGLSADGRALRYSVGATRAAIAAAERSAYRDGVVVDASVNVNQAIAGGVIEDGRRIMRRFSSGWFDNQRILWDAAKAEKTLVPGAPGELPAPAGPAQGLTSRSPGGSLAELIGEKSEQHVRVTRPDGKTLSCDALPCRSGKLLALTWRQEADALLLFERDASAREVIWLWKIGAPTARRIGITSGALRVPGRPPRCTAGHDALFCADARATIPPRLLRLDYATGGETILAEPNRDLARRVSAIAEPMAWPGGFTGYFLAPKTSKGPLPTVVQYYMCDGFLKGGTGDEIPMLPLVENGVAVLCIDAVRAPRAAGMEGSYDLALKTIGGALDALVAEGKVDPARVGIGGLSFGSSVALWSIRRSNRFAAATVASGQISPHYYWINAVPDRGFTATLKDYWNIGAPEENPERWKLASPVFDANIIDTPLLMQVPESELQSNIEFHTRLKRAGKPAEMVVFADELHIKYQPAHKRASYERNLDWFRFWLKNEEDPAALKAGQYLRWRNLRAGRSLPVTAR
jgi:acetyl esterase/lipase